jgi:anti-sigma-K factor RskA
MVVKESHEDYLELAAIHALGALDAEDRRRFEAHLASGCEACRLALAEAEAVAADLALAAPPVAPPDAVRRRLFHRVRRDLEAPAERKPAEPRRPVFLMALAAAATVAAIGLGLHARTLQRRVASERIARESIERELSSLTETLDAFTAPTTRAVSLAGQGDTPGAAAKAFLDPENRRLFLYVYNLPAPPPGRTYQLWLIVGGASPVSMGTFSVEPNGTGRLDASSIPAFEGAVTVAVTVEPEGGVPQPTGPMVLMGT